MKTKKSESQAPESVLAPGLVFRRSDLLRALGRDESLAKLRHLQAQHSKSENITTLQTIKADALQFLLGLWEEQEEKKSEGPQGAGEVADKDDHWVAEARRELKKVKPCAEDEEEQGSKWASYSLEDILFYVLLKAVSRADFLSGGFFRDEVWDREMRSMAQELGARIQVFETQPRTDYRQLETYLQRCFKGYNPFVAWVALNPVTSLESKNEKHGPEEISMTISDDPAVATDFLQRNAIMAGGAVNIMSFHSVIQPAMRRLGEDEKWAGKLPAMASLRRPELESKFLNPVESRMISLIRTKKRFDSPLTLTVTDRSIDKVEYFDFYNNIRVNEEAAKPETTAIHSTLDQGTIMNYKVHRRIKFDR